MLTKSPKPRLKARHGTRTTKAKSSISEHLRGRIPKGIRVAQAIAGVEFFVELIIKLDRIIYLCYTVKIS